MIDISESLSSVEITYSHESDFNEKIHSTVTENGAFALHKVFINDEHFSF